MHAIVTTPVFERHCKHAGLNDDDIAAIAAHLAANPLAGDVVEGAGGVRKVRFARRGKGKSGGYRTIHYYAGETMPLFLLALIDKASAANLTQAQRRSLSVLVPQLVQNYRGKQTS